jgi:hypothetical protein
LDFFPSGKRSSFQAAARHAVSLSRKIEKFPQDFGIAKKLRQEAGRLEAHAKHLRDVLRKHGRPDHDDGLSVLMMNVMALRPDFKNYEALSRVVVEAYETAGRGAQYNITADKLRRAAKEFTAKVEVQAKSYGDKKRATFQLRPGAQP